jgi:hypothetical protein
MVLKSMLSGNNYAKFMAMKIAIIGNGIAAWCINKYLRDKHKELIIHRYGEDTHVPTCSYRTTSINCMRGTKKGISPLGDLMVDSMHEFIAFYNREKVSGIEEAYEFQLWDKTDEKFTKRFGDFELVNKIEGIELSHQMHSYKSQAYLINPPKFYQSLNLDETKSPLVRALTYKDSVYELIADGYKDTYDKVILCAGMNNALFIDLFTNEDAIDFVKRTKPVKGDYLYLARDHQYPSMSLAIKNHHLIFRNNEILIGSTSFNENDSYLINEDALRAVYNNIVQHVKIEIPAYENFQAICGVRAKGRKRMPFWGEVAPNLYMIGGLYKNAFSFAFKAAKDITKDIL